MCKIECSRFNTIQHNRILSAQGNNAGILPIFYGLGHFAIVGFTYIRALTENEVHKPSKTCILDLIVRTLVCKFVDMLIQVIFHITFRKRRKINPSFPLSLPLFFVILCGSSILLLFPSIGPRERRGQLCFAFRPSFEHRQKNRQEDFRRGVYFQGK